jgi:hypothetical protein
MIDLDDCDRLYVLEAFLTRRLDDRNRPEWKGTAFRQHIRWVVRELRQVRLTMLWEHMEA